jgi:hypothetical protein
VVLDYGKPLQPEVQQTIVSLYEAGAAGVVILSNRDSATFAQRVAVQTRQVSLGVEGLGSQVPVVEVHQRALGTVIPALGIKLDEIRGAQSMKVQPLPNLRVSFHIKNEILDSSSAPNTIGILEGSDPELRNEYVVFSAHMDHIGISHGQADSINNGADDDGSGTAGVIELAEAFSQKGIRPKRSMIFLTVSGEEKGLYGSAYFTEHPTVPLTNIVADLNIDMIGRNWKDTIVAIGKEHSDLGSYTAEGQRGPSRAAHGRDRRPVAGGELLLEVRPLQLRPEGCADPVSSSTASIRTTTSRPIRPTRSTPRRNPGFSSCCSTSARKSETLPSGRSGIPTVTKRSSRWPVTDGEMLAILPRMSETTGNLKDFNAFRTRMNETILAGGNLTISRFFALDHRAYEPGALGTKTKEMLGPRVLAGPPVRRLYHLPHHSLRRGRRHRRGVP